MSEAKNGGLEVVATLTVSFDEGDGGSAIEQVETHMLLDEGAHDLCLHSEALTGYAVRDARIAELEAKTRTTMGVGSGSGNLFVHGDYDSIKAAQKIVIERDQLRAELAAIKAQSGEALAKIAKHAPAVNCSATTQLERVGLLAVHALIAFSAPNFSSPRAKADQTIDVPVAKQVVMPERKKWDASAGTAENMKSQAYNDALDAEIRLNAADQGGGQDE